jgi:hypothetical protein
MYSPEGLEIASISDHPDRFHVLAENFHSHAQGASSSLFLSISGFGILGHA